eukprot:CAMPEP_0202859970 /NCGR_PEP_ID=MMETSP1391-20130828/1868_1 /ASSEMBLY_ACC=CAM_ASM_000867 /TAXON_ID=1034604 /ORGANISM="Chlamydomonas leiostraca, Strain SAG 11-49" /LENGTH=262 /DNA_ID=CAMNT_0049539087 /DNA_START=5 /DNA_END=794 /DNA_ORIENTATION=+
MAPKIKELAQPVVTESGERVIAGTLRPDGTVRKERRVRQGYTPQEEQPTYQPRVVMARQNVPICPGMDPADLEAAKAAAVSKAAKKNEKRKEKKAEEGGSTGSSAAKPAAQGAGSSAAAKAAPAPSQPAQPAADAASAPADTPEQALNKQMRALNKKLRQAEALAAKAAEGGALTQEEKDKASKIDAWSKEVDQLQKQLDALKTADPILIPMSRVRADGAADACPAAQLAWKNGLVRAAERMLTTRLVALSWLYRSMKLVCV